MPVPLFEPPLAGVDIQAEAVSSFSKLVLSIPLTSKLRTSAAVKMLPEGMGYSSVGMSGMGLPFGEWLRCDCLGLRNRLFRKV